MAPSDRQCGYRKTLSPIILNNQTVLDNNNMQRKSYNINNNNNTNSNSKSQNSFYTSKGIATEKALPLTVACHFKVKKKK